MNENNVARIFQTKRRLVDIIILYYAREEIIMSRSKNRNRDYFRFPLSCSLC